MPDFTILAGLPTTIEPLGTSFVTTAQAPTTSLEPIATPDIMTELIPITELLPIVTLVLSLHNGHEPISLYLAKSTHYRQCVYLWD